MKTTLRLLFFLFAATVFVACSDDDDSDGTSSSSLVGGYWIPDDVESWLTENPEDGYGDNCFVFTDGSHGYLYSLDVDTEMLEGTKIGEKTIAGKKFYYVIGHYSDETESFTYTVNDSIVTITYTRSGDKEEMTFKDGKLVDEYTTWVKFK